jgi:hypothetical protein
VLEAAAAGSAWLRVTFDWRRDRFGHRIERLDAQRLVPVLVSVEEAPDEAPPPSPPLQQLHIEDRPGGTRVALLVGMSGQEHWSMSVEAPGHGTCLIFDVACRRSQIAVEPASCYRIAAADWTRLAVSPAGIVDVSEGWRLNTMAVGSEPAAALQVRDGRLSVRPFDSSQRTARWMYRVELEPNRVGKMPASAGGTPTQS